jgi:uncharacterized repeat protein (TIGR03806 family)
MKRGVGLILTASWLLTACQGELDERFAGGDTGEDAAVDTGSADAGGRADAGVPDRDAGGDAGGDAGEDASVEVPFGLDARPSNTTCLAGPRPTTDADVALERALPSHTFSRPLGLVQHPTLDDAWYVLEQGGVVRLVQGDQSTAVFDLSGEPGWSSQGERGLLGLAFHPTDRARAFVSYTIAEGGQLRSRVDEVAVDGAGAMDTAGRALVFTIDQPFNNHNGGHIAFGPDGMLYVALGDGGSGGDPINAGQDTSTALGSILRLDVDSGSPYAIPADNPFAGGGGAPEIYAWGLRNPWRFSFDQATGQMWAGDVGQNAQEEVNVIERGGNYGWKIYEGDACFQNHPECGQRPDLIEPVATYPHSDGRSITGGFVYRGADVPSLAGVYLYADYVSGRLWGLFPDGPDGALAPRVLSSAVGFNVSAFGQGRDGEVYVLDYRGGRVMKLVAGDPDPDRVEAPAELADTGCVDPGDPSQPAAGLIPYEPIAKFWSDGADKRRWVALPDGATVSVGADGALEFPVGTVFVKDFTRDGELMETRLFKRHDDGQWAGYSYAWRADGSGAELVTAGRVSQRASGPWRYPTQGECLGCHTDASGRVLGFELAQLTGPTDYGARRAPQRDTLDHVGVFDWADGARDLALPELVDPFDPTRTLDERARSYLHTNCASCHLTGGTARGELDLRVGTPLADTGLCDAPELETFGVADARVVAPGEPARSILLTRLRADGRAQMPALGGFVRDDAGVDLLERWVTGLSSCP